MPQDWFAENAPSSNDWFKANAPTTVAPGNELRAQSTMTRLTRMNPVNSRMPLSESIPNFVGDIGAAGINTLAHPLDTAKGVVSTLMHPADSLKALYQGLNTNPGVTVAQNIGQTAAMGGVAELAGGVAPKIAPAIGKAATAVGDVSQDAGTGIMNKTVGTMKADFKKGANPARGYLATGNGPALTMRGLADKASEAVTTTGANLDSAYKSADATGKLIPVNTVASAIAAPIQDAVGVATGVGAPKGLLGDLQYHASTFQNVLEQGDAQGGFTPSQVWQIKKDLAKATSWSDPTQIGLKSVTQQQVGALSGVLKDAVPETADLNQNYMDLLKMAGRAEERANTGSRPLTAHIYANRNLILGGIAGEASGNALAGVALGAALDSVPFKSTLATGLYRGGRALSSLGDRLAPTDGAPVKGVSADNFSNDGAYNKNSNPQSTPPRLGDGRTGANGNTPPTAGPDAWANAGAAKVVQHIASDTSSGLTKTDIADAVAVPQGKQLLINASDLRPGSSAMKNVVSQIKDISNAAQTQETLAPGEIGRMPLANLSIDPKKFQYKLNTDTAGASNKLRDVPWNDSLSGVVTAWKAPDGQDYVVNGHHRVELAARNGVNNIAVRMLPEDVKTPAEARIIGAMQNIAEGNGTATDAAKFLRDSSYTPEDLARSGVSLSGPIAEGGTALARLSPQLFDDVVAGRIPERRGIAIGNAAETPAQQEALLKMISRSEARGRTVSNATIEELGRMVKGAEDVASTQDSLFGMETQTHNLALEKADVSAYLRGQIASEKRLFGGLTSESKARTLGSAGSNIIDTKNNAVVAGQATQAAEIYDKLSMRSGPIDDILNSAAKRIAGGENAATVKAEAYRSLRTTLSEALPAGQR